LGDHHVAGVDAGGLRVAGAGPDRRRRRQRHLPHRRRTALARPTAPDHARGLDLPVPILSAASQARALAAGQPGIGIPEGRIRTSKGRWLRLHAARLTPEAPHGTGQTAVILEPARPADLSPLILDLYGLTSRERQITQLLLRGLPTADIAQMLFISRHTLSDHLKTIFGKLGVSSRPELTALLLDQLTAST
jgi:DNA-binding CsgD family transcriptional regulator